MQFSSEYHARASCCDYLAKSPYDGVCLLRRSAGAALVWLVVVHVCQHSTAQLFTRTKRTERSLICFVSRFCIVAILTLFCAFPVDFRRCARLAEPLSDGVCLLGRSMGATLARLVVVHVRQHSTVPPPRQSQGHFFRCALNCALYAAMERRVVKMRALHILGEE